MLHQVALDAGCPFEALRESSGNCALPCPRDADDQDDHGLPGYLFLLADHESIVNRDGAGDSQRQPSADRNGPAGGSITGTPTQRQLRALA